MSMTMTKRSQSRQKRSSRGSNAKGFLSINRWQSRRHSSTSSNRWCSNCRSRMSSAISCPRLTPRESERKCVRVTRFHPRSRKRCLCRPCQVHCLTGCALEWSTRSMMIVIETTRTAGSRHRLQFERKSRICRLRNSCRKDRFKKVEAPTTAMWLRCKLWVTLIFPPGKSSLRWSLRFQIRFCPQQ